MVKDSRSNYDSAESLAIAALAYLAEEPERLGRFLALSGLGAATIRSAATDARFLAGVLEHVVGDERLLIAFARACGVEPAEVERAHAKLAGPAWERDAP